MPAGGAPQISQMYLPLRIESRVEGVLVVGEKRGGASFSAEDGRLLLAFSNQLAIAVERENFAEQHTRARALEESDRLKSALVSSVSHELKTPLAAIKVSATTLLESAASPDAAVRLELADAINRETDRLTPGRKSTVREHNVEGSPGTQIIPELYKDGDYVIELSDTRYQGGARPVEQQAMQSNGSIDKTAASKLPAVSGTPVFLNASQNTDAANFLAANWAKAVS